MPRMLSNSQRGKIKPVQAARLLRLAIDKRASRRDRAWAIETLVATKESMGHENLMKAVKKLTDKDIRLKPRLRNCLRKISSEPEGGGARTLPSLRLRART
jgi:hypothetical protein